MIIYLHPFNERVRTMLRLDELYRRFERLVSRNDSLSHHAALGTLFEIMELSSRAEVRADLLHELERQRQRMPRPPCSKAPARPARHCARTTG